MKTIRHTTRARVKILHIEADGCIVNIHVGLHDAKGRAVTHVEVLADQFAGERHCHVVTSTGRKSNGLAVRVIRDLKATMG